MSLAPLLFAALVPAATPVPHEAGDTPPALVRLDDAPEPPASAVQHVVAKVLQVTGGEAAGIVVGIAGGATALAPGLVLYSMDSGNVGGSAILAGMGIGYSWGASWAICAAGQGILDSKASLRDTALGVATGLVLVGGSFGTGLVPETREAVVLAALVPPLAGIAVFEMTKDGPAVRKDVTESAFMIGTLGVAAAAVAVLRITADIEPATTRRVLVPLVGIRW